MTELQKEIEESSIIVGDVTPLYQNGQIQQVGNR